MKHIYFLGTCLLLMTAGSLSAATSDPLEGVCGRRAQYNQDSTNLQWEVDTVAHTLTITGKGRMRDYDTDTKAPWYPWRDYIYKASFPNGMTTVGSRAMYYLTKLTDVIWDGNTVTDIYNWAFYGCSSLKTITIPNSVTLLDNRAFCSCTSLEQITLSNALKSINWHVFESCTSLKQITLPNSVTSIARGAFKYCSSLETVNWSNSLISISDSAFYSCSGLKQLAFPASLQSIGTRSFQNCPNIETIDFGNAPTNIGYEAFQPASSLVSIKSKRIKSINVAAFYNCPKLIDLQLGDSLTIIYDQAFYNCQSLQSIHFPATLTPQLSQFYPTSFQYCYALDKITIDPANPKYDSRNNCNAVIHKADSTLVFGCCKTVIPSETKTIGSLAFCYCKRLETITIPEGVQTIQSSAFYECNNLKTIAFPNSLRAIQTDAFRNCDGLTAIVLPEGLETLGTAVFYGCDKLASVYLPNSVTNISCEVFLACDSLKTPVYNTTYFVYLPTDYEGAYTIPGNPQKIACGAFENCSKLTAVQIPSSVTEIGNSTFNNCTSLQTAPLPDQLTYLGSFAFQNCNNLASITLPEGIRAINQSTFQGCATLPSIVIPDAVTAIYENAFSGCKALVSISFPADMSSFGARILNGCNNLQTIIWNVRQYNSFNANNSKYDPFYGIRGQITDFTFGDSVQVIPSQLCYGMNKLTSLSLGASIQTIGSNAFGGCSGIKSVHWNIRTYPDPQFYTASVFYDLRNIITEFTFGDSVRHIPAYLCHSMNRLRQLRIPKNVSSIGRYAFRYVSALDSISVDANNTDYDSRHDCNALIETSSDVLLLGCYKTQIPDDISGVGECAFRNVRKLNTVELPQTATFVGSEAFNGCHDLKDLTLSENIETIDDYAFQDCDSLTVITLPADLKQIGLRAFANCTQLQSVVVNATTPPVIDATSFSNTTCPFQVPCAAIPTYRQAPVWSDLGSRVTGQAVFKLTVEQNDYGAGKTTIVQQPNCERNAIIEAEPERGYYFAGWQDKSGTMLSTEVRYEFPLEEDLTIVAFFLRKIQGIDEILQDDTAVWYDIMGHRIATPTASGVYIVQQGSETFKVVIP